ncbi:MAG: hypothetical protein KA841_00405 [Chitinophagales bacterium]|nr:hypothetical protein [Chitinophagales bacterium]
MLLIGSEEYLFNGNLDPADYRFYWKNNNTYYANYLSARADFRSITYNRSANFGANGGENNTFEAAK